VDKLLQRIKKAYHLDKDAEVANFLGINPSTLSMQKNRGNYDLNRIINKCSDLNMNWLLHGEGSMRYKNGDSSNNSVNIPIYPDGNFFNNDKSSKITKELFRLILDGRNSVFLDNNSSPERMKGFTVNSDAMSPTLRKQDVAIIDTNSKKVKDEAIFLLSYEDSAICRRLEITESGDYCIYCDNDAYKPIKVSKPENKFCIIGKIVMVLRKI